MKSQQPLPAARRRYGHAATVRQIDSPGQVDLERRVHRHQARLLGEDGRIVGDGRVAQAQAALRCAEVEQPPGAGSAAADA